MTENDIWFGNRRVAPARKRELVQDVFSSVANKYDLMNDLMSLGIHRLWKDEMVDWAMPRNGQTILDVAGGTGDIAFRMKERTNGARVLVCDLTPEMILRGRDKAVDRNMVQGIEWVAGNAECLPLRDSSVDLYTIAFGLRNVVHINHALTEACRVLRPGGRFLCLEFSHLALDPLKKLYDTYSFSVLPRLGQWIANDADSYLYLAQSIRRFPPQEDLCHLMRKAGMSLVKYRNLSLGIAALHSGWRT